MLILGTKHIPFSVGPPVVFKNSFQETYTYIHLITTLDSGSRMYETQFTEFNWYKMSAVQEMSFRPSLLVHTDKPVAECDLKVNYVRNILIITSSYSNNADTWWLRLQVTVRLRGRARTRTTRVLRSSVVLPNLAYLKTVSTFVKYVSCLGDTVYQDSSSLTQLFCKELTAFYYLTHLRHVSYVQNGPI
jgi:hypothetical protein